jgi:DNA-binding IclR family transcriptional regulator
MWSRGSSRDRRAVLAALEAVGETGMTVLALGIAVDKPENHVQSVLEDLVATGLVRRGGAGPWGVTGPQAASYYLARFAPPAVDAASPRVAGPRSRRSAQQA